MIVKRSSLFESKQFVGDLRTRKAPLKYFYLTTGDRDSLIKSNFNKWVQNLLWLIDNWIEIRHNWT